MTRQPFQAIKDMVFVVGGFSRQCQDCGFTPDGDSKDRRLIELSPYSGMEIVRRALSRIVARFLM